MERSKINLKIDDIDFQVDLASFHWSWPPATR
jgi:hypothetical protein